MYVTVLDSVFKLECMSGLEMKMARLFKENWYDCIWSAVEMDFKLRICCIFLQLVSYLKRVAWKATKTTHKSVIYIV